MGMLRLLSVLVLMIHQTRIILVEAQTPLFDYPPFLLSDTNLLMGGDTKLTEADDSTGAGSYVTLNPSSDQFNLSSPDSCGSLLYRKPLQMRGSDSSFTTSFTFSIASEDSANAAGFAFVLLPQNHTTGIPGGKLCLMPRNLDATSSQFFAVEFDTFKNPEFNDTSNNHVGVNINSMNSSFTYNLCGDGIDECTYLMFNPLLTSPLEFTSWIEYDSVTKNLAVFLTNGSTLNDIAKPASAIIKAPVDLSDVMTDNMFVGFTGSTISFIESKKITSWRFRSSARLTEAPPPSGPINNGTSPPLAPINNGTSPGIKGPPGLSQGSNGSTAKLVVGIVGSVAGVLVILLIYKIFRLFNRPLRIFLSHAGGKDQGGKNFPDWLYDEMTSSWKLKHFIEVFLDRRRLEKGKKVADKIIEALGETEVGIVVVTPEFFTKKWPMTELISFMRSQDYKPAVKILPLFYQMRVDQVRENLRKGVWEVEWTEFSRHGNHPLVMEDCRAAVQQLCDVYGIEYNFNDGGHDREYIKLILKEVGGIVRKGLLKR